MAMAVEEARKLEAQGYSKEDAKAQAMQKLLEGVEELADSEEGEEQGGEVVDGEDCETGNPMSSNMEEEPEHKPFFTSPKKKVVVIAKIKK